MLEASEKRLKAAKATEKKRLELYELMSKAAEKKRLKAASQAIRH